MKRILICNIPVDVLTKAETVKLIDDAISENRSIHHVVINSAKVVNAQKDTALKQSIINCDIINADGQGIVWASKFLNRPLPERVTGIDLMEEIIVLAAEKKYKIFFLGAREEIVSKVVEIYSKKFGDQIIAGYRNGYFSENEEENIARHISDSNANILFVAMNSPKKEVFLNKYKHLFKGSFIMGVGGSFDVVSGHVKRAPKWMQNFGLEWFFRTLQEPRRMWKRYLFGNSTFVYMVMKEKAKQIFKRIKLFNKFDKSQE
jgi:N-acetylglucosaminyldiphosphoundecaprenol N-acetyl-beta-D-mannosaminyltransferase